MALILWKVDYLWDKTARETMKDERIGHLMTRRTDESMEQEWTFVCTDREFNI
jgi:hypothetical protein